MKKEKLPDPSKLKWVKQGPLATEEDIHPANVKVRITTYISEDVYRWLKREADRTGTPYQILLNQRLRQRMEDDVPGSFSERIGRLEKELQRRLKKKAA